MLGAWMGLAWGQVVTVVGSLPADGAVVPHQVVPVVLLATDEDLPVRWRLVDAEGELVVDGVDEGRHGQGERVVELRDLPWLESGRYTLVVAAGDLEERVRFRVDGGPASVAEVWGSSDGETLALWTQPGAVVVVRDADGRRQAVVFADGEGVARLDDPGTCVTARAQGADGARGMTFDSCARVEELMCGVGCDSLAARGLGWGALGALALVPMRRRRRDVRAGATRVMRRG